MLNDEIIEKLNERLILRIEEQNEYILKQIGEALKEIGKLSPTQAKQIQQMIKYGADFDKIIKKIKQISKKNVKEIYEIFDEVAKSDYTFAEQFYEYRNKKYISWEKNNALRQQIKALAKTTAEAYLNLTNTSTLGIVKIVDGKVVFQQLRHAYTDALDRAFLSISQGKTTFDTEVRKIIKEFGGYGIRTIFENGRTMRLDSAVRMTLQGGLRNMHMEVQKQFGEEFESDGVEISVHGNPAPDHEEVQGRQFSNEEFDKFQNDEDAVSYDGIEFPAIAEETGRDRRAIGQYNCYHYIFAVILGVSKPRYTNEQLQNIIDKNNKGFEFEGKHYTNYEGEQLLRKVELELRKSKDTQILARSSNNAELVGEMQSRITQLTSKYRDILKVSGLKSKLERAKVSGYRRVNVAKMK